MFKNMNESSFLASFSIFVIAAFNAMTGWFFVTVDNDVSSPTYAKMNEVLSLDVYGVGLLASAVLLVCAIFQQYKAKHIFYIVGGLVGAILLGLYAMASTLGAPFIILPLRYALITFSNAVIFGMGVWGLWKIKK